MNAPLDLMTRELAAADPGLVGNSDVLRGVLAGCGDCIKILDLEGRLQFMSDGGKRVMEVDDFTALKGCPWPDFWQGEGNAQAHAAVADAKAGRTGRFKNIANTAKGRARYWDVQVSPIFGESGAISHLLSISRDITDEWTLAEEQRANADRQRFLIAELTHRVKNILATVLGIAKQTFRGEVYRDATAAFHSRLMTLSAAYVVLTESSWAESDFGRIIASAATPFQDGGERISMTGPPLSIAPSNAVMLALAINELATNAMKYGALSEQDGRVEIQWHKTGPAGAEKLHFEWREYGGPQVATPTRFGFGSRLITQILAQEFGGAVDLKYEPTGVVCKLDAPLRTAVFSP